MNLDRKKLIALLEKETESMKAAARQLGRAYKAVSSVSRNSITDFTDSDFDRFELLTSRFARLSDIFIQKILRLVNTVELEPEGTIVDILNRAEKKSVIASADAFTKIRLLRNEIAHEYSHENLLSLFTQVQKMTPVLLEAVEKAQQYIRQYFA
ncbi:MAG: hypothetical protein JXA66_09125 [Oligoflexia bacterium]|nr:hypothetical protein [Oligoflexia bacterium]